MNEDLVEILNELNIYPKIGSESKDYMWSSASQRGRAMDKIKKLIDKVYKAGKEAECKRVIEILNRLENAGEQLEMEGKKYTEGYENCRQTLLNILDNE